MSSRRAKEPEPTPERALERAKALGLFGIAAHWQELRDQPFVERLLQVEEEERGHRSLQRRIKNARCGRFKPLADFDWSWPKRIDREHVEELFRLEFLNEGANVVFVGPNGVGKTTLAQNLAYQAVLKGHTVRFTSASQMLAELAAQDSPSVLQRRLRRFVHPSLLIVDELGYLSYDSRHADLLFDIVNRRQDKSTVVTTNRAFRDWGEVFPNSCSVVALVDRLVHKAEIVEIDGESYRRKEAEERKSRRAERKKASRRRKTEP